MSIDFATLKEWGAIVVAFLAFVAMPIGLFLSIKRNRREIDNFNCQDIDELKLWIPSYQLKWISKKLAKLGWNLISSEPDPQTNVNTQVHFKKASLEASDLKSVLHALNRSFALPVYPMNLRRENEDEKD